jgi:hypothetical protein
VEGLPELVLKEYSEVLRFQEKKREKTLRQEKNAPLMPIRHPAEA